MAPMTAGTGSRRRRSATLLGLAATVLLAAGCGGARATGEQATGKRDARTAGTRIAGAGAGCQTQLAQAGAHGQFAFVRNGGISLLDLPSCRTRVVYAQGDAQGPLRFSADGRFIAFGDGAVIPTTGAGEGTNPALPLGLSRSWAWSPHGAELAGVTRGGGVSLWSPGGLATKILPNGWGASGVAFAPGGGRLVVVRETQGLDGKRPNELWAVGLHSHARRLLHRLHGVEAFEGEGAGIAGFTPNGQDVLVWPDLAGSASIAADGLPLLAVPLAGGRAQTLLPKMLAYGDYIADCGESLVVAAGRGRESNVGKRLALLSPPSFRARPLRLSDAQTHRSNAQMHRSNRSDAQSWTTPSCSEDGEIATAAGPSRQEPRFGLERRAIWLLRSAHSRPQRLTDPAPRVTDELPRIAPDGRYVLFIETKPRKNGTGPGTLELLDLAAGGAKLVGPIAQLGSAGSYYGHYPWAQLTAWRPRA